MLPVIHVVFLQAAKLMNKSNFSQSAETLTNILLKLFNIKLYPSYYLTAFETHWHEQMASYEMKTIS